MEPDAEAFFAANLAPRRPAGRVGILGAGGDEHDLEAGRAHLARLAPGGWLAPTWPTDYGGRGASSDEAAEIARALSRYDVPDLYPFAVGLSLVGPTLLVHGTHEQRVRWLPPILDGSEIWCQLFSEPDAGSDLASLSCRAERDGDEWVVTGQKVWSSRAHYAQWGLLLTRTNVDVPKHAGITAFGIDMRQAAIEVRPLRQLNGDEHFNQVFLSGARVPDADRIGELDEGWSVARTTLAFERGAMGGGAGGGGGGGAGIDDVVELVRGHRAAALDAVDGARRDQAARAIVGVEVARLTGQRARIAARAGRSGPEASGGKIRLADNLKDLGDLALGLRGPGGVAADGPLDDDWTTVFLTAPSVSIRGGTDEIQRNVIGERVLGLPRDPSP